MHVSKLFMNDAEPCRITGEIEIIIIILFKSCWKESWMFQYCNKKKIKQIIIKVTIIEKRYKLEWNMQQ